MTTPKRNPWFKFYPQDWRGDSCLRQCPLSARGLLIELLGIMHEAPHTGYLEDSSGRPMSREAVARIAAASVDEVGRDLQVLLDYGVLSKSADGRVYSRRMVRTSAVSARRSKSGKKGGIASQDKQTLASGNTLSSFSDWWKGYPARPGGGRGNKGACQRIWADLTDRERRLIPIATEAMRREREPQYIPQADTFLRPPREGGDPRWVQFAEREIERDDASWSRVSAAGMLDAEKLKQIESTTTDRRVKDDARRVLVQLREGRDADGTD